MTVVVVVSLVGPAAAVGADGAVAPHERAPNAAGQDRAGGQGDGDGGDGEDRADRSTPAATVADPPDPAEDVLGWENGYWYNESIEVNQSDGLTDAETEAYVARAMARVEQIRRFEFTADVEVEAIDRGELRRRNAAFANESGEPASYWEWNNQV